MKVPLIKDWDSIIRRTGLWTLCLVPIIFIILSSCPYDASIAKIDLHAAAPSIPHNNIIKRIPYKKADHKKACDLYKGRWIWDRNSPLYTNRTCSTIPDSKNCAKSGREDLSYVNWRWQPNDCDLPKFKADDFLRLVAGKKLGFVGDSVARNQMESLLCLLSQVETPNNVFQSDDDKCRTWYFPSSNFTLVMLWTQYIVDHSQTQINGSSVEAFDLHLDKVDKNWTKSLPDLDLAIISSGHWFFRKLYLYEADEIIGCWLCDEPHIKNLRLAYAYKRAFQTAFKHINHECEKCQGLVTLVRTFSPAHFENGTWNNGGRCNRTSPVTDVTKLTSLGGSTEWELRTGQVEEVERAKVEGVKRGNRFGVLDVTRAMLMRPDGHPDTHWNNNWMPGYSDCVHWCLPGPIDAWNQFLLEALNNLQV